MADLNLQLKNFQDKLQLLLKQYRHLQKENAALKNEIQKKILL